VRTGRTDPAHCHTRATRNRASTSRFRRLRLAQSESAYGLRASRETGCQSRRIDRAESVTCRRGAETRI
jgi:hypothetical protein